MYNAIISVLVHFESYRNIDLLHQGLYYLSATLTSENKIDVGLPMDVYNDPHQHKPKKGKFNYHNVFPARLEDFVFNTRTFTIRYCEEDIKLCDLCEFRIEIPADRDLGNANYVLRLQLHFADLNHIGGADELPERVKEVTNFKLVATQRYIIRGIANGITQYIQFQSNGHYFGVCNATIHSALIDFRFRPTRIKSPLEVKSMPSKKRLVSFCEYLFANNKGQIPEEVYPEVVNKMYTGYASALVNSFALIKNSFLEIANKCLTEQQRLNNPSLLRYQELIIQEDEDVSVRKGSFKSSFTSEEVKQPKWNVGLPLGERKAEIDHDFEDTDENATKHSIGLAFRPNKMPSSDKVLSTFHKTYSLKSSKDPYECASKFTLEITNISGQVIELWQRYISLITLTSRLVKEMFYLRYINQVITNKYNLC